MRNLESGDISEFRGAVTPDLAADGDDSTLIQTDLFETGSPHELSAECSVRLHVGVPTNVKQALSRKRARRLACFISAALFCGLAVTATVLMTASRPSSDLLAAKHSEEDSDVNPFEEHDHTPAKPSRERTPKPSPPEDPHLNDELRSPRDDDTRIVPPPPEPPTRDRSQSNKVHPVADLARQARHAFRASNHSEILTVIKRMESHDHATAQVYRGWLHLQHGEDAEAFQSLAGAMQTYPCAANVSLAALEMARQGEGKHAFKANPAHFLKSAEMTKQSSPVLQVLTVRLQLNSDLNNGRRGTPVDSTHLLTLRRLCPMVSDSELVELMGTPCREVWRMYDILAPSAVPAASPSIRSGRTK